MTGDAEFSFHFQPGHSTEPTSLFDLPECRIEPKAGEPNVCLFSGGIDSLCGALDLLAHEDKEVILVSHQSQPGTVRTQKSLVDALDRLYPRRVAHFKFECTLKGARADEETQRSRSFLYTSVAYAIAWAYGQKRINVFENGVTSINLRRREDLANARASRTTHPQTMARMATLLSLIDGQPFEIALPYLFSTKTDVIRKLASVAEDLLASSVSCSRTVKKRDTTHCGHCFQCIDRRIASYAAEAETIDHRGLYMTDIVSDHIDDREARNIMIDYIRQAKSFSEDSADKFYEEYLSDLAECLDYLPLDCLDQEKVCRIWDLFRKHGNQVRDGLNRIRALHEDVFESLPEHSLLHLISLREYLKPEVERLVATICKTLQSPIAEMFARHRPVDEPDLNEKLGAFLRSHEPKIRSEHPNVSFACARVIPDHGSIEVDLLIEAKYIRGNTSPSKATEGIAADLTKYPDQAYILFIVYDPEHKILDDNAFCKDIRAKRPSRVLIIR